jgi:hypothetical protein
MNSSSDNCTIGGLLESIIELYTEPDIPSGRRHGFVCGSDGNCKRIQVDLVEEVATVDKLYDIEKANYEFRHGNTIDIFVY